MSDALPKYLDQPAVRAILTEAYRRSPRDGLMFETTYLYGLRVSELVKLDRPHYKRAAARLLINRSKGSISGEAPIFEHLLPKLDAYLGARSDAIPALFAGRQGRLTTRRVQDLFDAAAKAAGVELNAGQGIHCLRHSIAVHLLEQGWDVIEVQKHLGHRRISSTQVYANISDRRRNDRLKALSTSDKIVML
jgi:site-specific recombinase XerD